MNNSEHRGSPAAVRRCTLRWCLCGKWTDTLLFIVVHSAAHACAEITVLPVPLAYPHRKRTSKRRPKLDAIRLLLSFGDQRLWLQMVIGCYFAFLRLWIISYGNLWQLLLSTNQRWWFDNAACVFLFAVVHEWVLATSLSLMFPFDISLLLFVVLQQVSARKENFCVTLIYP